MALELVTYLARNLVQQPNALQISSRLEERVTFIDIRCAPEDAGRIIGRQGRIINSIRTLARAATEGREKVVVNLIDQPPASVDATPDVLNADNADEA